MTENYFWETSNKEALEATGLTELASSFYMANIRARLNDLLVLRYDSDFKIEKDDMDNYIKFTNLKELKKAKVGSNKIKWMDRR